MCVGFTLYYIWFIVTYYFFVTRLQINIFDNNELNGYLPTGIFVIFNSMLISILYHYVQV